MVALLSIEHRATCPYMAVGVLILTILEMTWLGSGAYPGRQRYDRKRLASLREEPEASEKPSTIDTELGKYS